MRRVTFKGRIKNGEIKKIRLSSNTGLKGYKVIDFRIMPRDPLTENALWILQLFSNKITTVPSTIDFDAPSLMAAASYTGNATATDFPEDLHIIFDDKIVNQTMFLAAHRAGGSSCNYYILLEETKLSDSEAAAATLMDLRASNE